MKKEINKKLAELHKRLEQVESNFAEWDNSEDMHMIEHIKFTISEFRDFKKRFAE